MVADVELVWTNKSPSPSHAHEYECERALIDDSSLCERPEVTTTDPLGSGDICGKVVIADSLCALSAFDSFRIDDSRQPIRLVYIDPPYNTGRSFAQYDDAMPHSEWLSMLRERLQAVRPHLAHFASVWVHLDDGEQHRARCVLDEVFGENSFVATIIWQKRTTRESRSAFSSSHDYIHVYAPAGPQKWKRSRNRLPKSTSHLRNRDGDPRGPWADAPFTAPGYRANQQYTIVNPAGIPVRPPVGRSWYAIESTFEKLYEDGRIWFPKNGAGSPRIKIFAGELRGLVPSSLWSAEETGTNDDAKRHMMSLFPDRNPFETPKPEKLLKRIIHIASDPGDLIVDFFAGSGTTASAAHKMGRKWVAIERSIQTVQSFLVPRMVLVAQGDDAGGITESVGWQGGGAFDVAELRLPGTSDKLRYISEPASRGDVRLDGSAEAMWRGSMQRPTQSNVTTQHEIGAIAGSHVA